MVNAAIVATVRRYLATVARQGIDVQCGVLFGSQVTGQSDTWSDIDLLVISPRFDEHYSRADVNLLWHLAARTDSRIEPIPVGVRQYAEDDSSAIIEIARRWGKTILLEDDEISNTS